MPDQELLTISSLQNARIKDIVKLRQRSHRDASSMMIIEGLKEIRMALRNNHKISELFVCKDLIENDSDNELIQLCQSTGTEIFECTMPVFQKIAYRDNPQGLLAIAPSISRSLNSFQPPPNALIIIAESIEKPGNLGTILRSADATGVNAVIVCDRCTDINNPNVIRASIGTIFSIPVIEASSSETLAWLKENHIQSIAATPNAKSLYTDLNMTTATAIIVGAEQPGLSEMWIQNTDHQVVIPMTGQADSLNVASATTIILYEALRQRSLH